MKNTLKALYAIALLILCINLFYSCKGNDGLCYANLDFEITENEECGPGEYVGFDLKFVDKRGDELIRSYIIPASVQSHVIALAPNRSYDVFLKNTGVQNGCGGPIFFDIVVSDPDDDDECFRMNVSVDERPGGYVRLTSFDLGETCDECPTFEGAE